jgi:hypothetical protein
MTTSITGETFANIERRSTAAPALRQIAGELNRAAELLDAGTTQASAEAAEITAHIIAGFTAMFMAAGVEQALEQRLASMPAAGTVH